MKDPVPIATKKIGNWLTAAGWFFLVTGLTILAWPKRLQLEDEEDDRSEPASRRS
jgi:hypothetical protein